MYGYLCVSIKTYHRPVDERRWRVHVFFFCFQLLAKFKNKLVFISNIFIQGGSHYLSLSIKCFRLALYSTDLYRKLLYSSLINLFKLKREQISIFDLVHDNDEFFGGRIFDGNFLGLSIFLWAIFCLENFDIKLGWYWYLSLLAKMSVRPLQWNMTP